MTDLLTEVIEKTGYTESLEADDPEELEARVQNIDELVSKAAVYEESCSDRGERPTLSGFLEEVALVADIDSVAEDRDYVILMTLHSAKGLEFPQYILREWKTDCSQVICRSAEMIRKSWRRNEDFVMWA